MAALAAWLECPTLARWVGPNGANALGAVPAHELSTPPDIARPLGVDSLAPRRRGVTLLGRPFELVALAATERLVAVPARAPSCGPGVAAHGGTHCARAPIVALRHDVGALSRELVTAQRGMLASSVLSQPGTRIVELTGGQGARVAVAVAPTGTAVLTAISLPSLPRSQTYQLWGITERGAVSLELLGTRPTVSIVQTPRTGLVALAITREPATGVVAPTDAPLVEAHLA